MKSNVKNTEQILNTLENFVTEYNLKDFLEIDHVGFVCEDDQVFDEERKYKISKAC